MGQALLPVSRPSAVSTPAQAGVPVLLFRSVISSLILRSIARSSDSSRRKSIRHSWPDGARHASRSIAGSLFVQILLVLELLLEARHLVLEKQDQFACTAVRPPVRLPRRGGPCGRPVRQTRHPQGIRRHHPHLQPGHPQGVPLRDRRVVSQRRPPQGAPLRQPRRRATAGGTSAPPASHPSS